MTNNDIRIWDLWYPKGGATCVPFARGRLGVTDVLWVHSPPEYLSVEIRDDDGQMISKGKDLKQTADFPMARLVRLGERITREDKFPSQDHIGSLVILP